MDDIQVLVIVDNLPIDTYVNEREHKLKSVLYLIKFEILSQLNLPIWPRKKRIVDKDAARDKEYTFILNLIMLD